MADALESYHVAVRECRSLVDDISSLQDVGLIGILFPNRGGKAQPETPSEQSLKRRVRKRLRKLSDCYKSARAREPEAKPTLAASNQSIRAKSALGSPRHESVWDGMLDTAHEAVLDGVEYVLCLGAHVGVPFAASQYKQETVANRIRQNQERAKRPPRGVHISLQLQKRSHLFNNAELEAFYRIIEGQRFPKLDQLDTEYVRALKWIETQKPPGGVPKGKQAPPAAKLEQGGAGGGAGKSVEVQAPKVEDQGKKYPWGDDDPETPVTPAKLADRLGIPGDGKKAREALRKRLETWRNKNRDGGWVEVADRKPRQAGYLYPVGKIWPVVEDLKPSG